MTDARSASATVSIKPAAGWWPALVVVACDGCGWAERVNLNDAPVRYADRLAAQHRCNDCCEDGPVGHTEQEHHDASACYDQSCPFDHPDGGPFTSDDEDPS